MKKFLSGFLAGVLVVGVSISALAITGNMTIEVYPINIQVNGEVFAPTDVNGKDVPVFAYEGTTYAPLRALAEAYGLEVGYDAEKNMATVNLTNDTPPTTNEGMTYEDFRAMWEIEFSKYATEDNGTKHAFFNAHCIIPNYSDKDLRDLYDHNEVFCDELGKELMDEKNVEHVNIFFQAENGYWQPHYTHR